MDTQKREQILALLEKDSRLAPAEVAVLTGLDCKEVEEEIKKMEQERLICGYHALINWEKTDDNKISAMIELKVTPQRGDGFDKIAEKIYNYPEVEALYLVSGGYDFLVILKKATMKEIAHFVSSKLATIDEVQSTATHVLLNRYKEFGINIYETPKKDTRMVVTP